MADELKPTVESRRQRSWVTFLALLLVYLPYLHAFWIHQSGREISIGELMLYPLLLGGAEVALILILIRSVFRERVRDLNRGAGRWWIDILSGLLLCVVSFAVMIVPSTLNSIVACDLSSAASFAAASPPSFENPIIKSPLLSLLRQTTPMRNPIQQSLVSDFRHQSAVTANYSKGPIYRKFVNST